MFCCASLTFGIQNPHVTRLPPAPLAAAPCFCYTRCYKSALYPLPTPSMYCKALTEHDSKFQIQIDHRHTITSCWLVARSLGFRPARGCFLRCWYHPSLLSSSKLLLLLSGELGTARGRG